MSVKRRQKKEWVRDTKFKTRKINVDSNHTYDQLLMEMKKEMGVKSRCVLLDGNNQEIQREEFSFVNFVLKQRKYLGATRMYLGIKPASAADKVAQTGIMLEEVKFFIQKVLDQERANRTNITQHGEEICNTDLFSPESDSPRLRLFEIEYNAVLERKETVFGNFCLVPEQILQQYLDFTYEGSEYCYILDTALTYYLKNHAAVLAASNDIGNGVIRMKNEHARQYEDWLQQMKAAQE